MKKLFLLFLLLWPTVAWSAHHEAAEHAVNWLELLLQSVTFFMFVAGVYYAARKPARKFFLARHEAVKAAVTEAKKAVEEASAKAREYALKMQDLDRELKQLRATFADQALAEKERLLKDAEAAAKKVQKDAELVIASELQKAQEQLRGEAADLAVKLAEDILRREIKADDHKRLVEDFMKTLTHRLKQEAA